MEFWTYTLLRLVLVVGTTAVVWGVYALEADTINLLVVVLVAAAISSVLSWKLLAGPRVPRGGVGVGRGRSKFPRYRGILRAFRIQGVPPHDDLVPLPNVF